MKRILILIAVLVGVALLTVGCNNANEEEPQKGETNNVAGLVIGYSSEDKEEIFGSLSTEEIGDIIGKITDEVAEDENYADNLDSIIERAFKESGINDTERLEAAKAKLTIINNGSLTIKWDVNIEKEIFGELSKEEITSLLTDIGAEVYEDENYENNLDSIIEKVFKEHGIDDSSKLDAAKSSIKVSYSNSK